ncbi:protein SCO1/2 [Beijerinckia sp. 28-YEA-48]|nr:protein SCO1/2 [Beijerinckia sp. 28-YEA-48]
MITARFSLVDHNGRAVSEADYRGRYLLVYFGFTHCRVVCPRALGVLSGALDRLDVGDRLAPLYITVDPARDTPAVMKAYLASNHPRFTGLTGTAEHIDAAKRAFRVFAERKPDAEDPDGYAVPHTAISYLIGPDGTYRSHFLDGTDEAAIATRTGQLMHPAGDDAHL